MNIRWVSYAQSSMVGHSLENFSDEGDHLLLTPGNAYMSGGIKIRPGKEKILYW